MRHIVSPAVVFCVVLLAVASIATADVPTLMQYQGFLTDDSGEPLDTMVDMTFTIYDASTGSGVIWTETQDTVTVNNGLFHVLLGSVNPIVDTVFAETERWLGITVDPDPEIVPRTRLVTVPWALRVSTVDGASGGAITGDLEAYAIITGFVGTGDLDASGNIHASGSITSGSSITIDGTAGVITSTTGIIDFDDENLITTGKVGIGAINSSARLNVESSDLYSSGRFVSSYPSAGTEVVSAEFTGSGSYDAKAVYGRSVPEDYYGYGGYFEGGFTGVLGQALPTGDAMYMGVYGLVSGGSGTNIGAYGLADGTGMNYGVVGVAADGFAAVNYGVFGRAENSATRYGVYGQAQGTTDNYAGYFHGNVYATGTVTQGGGLFTIDHPLDPENKYLCHSSVVSPDMMNVYNGNVILDANGETTVELPEYFEAVNRDFRYQLTCVGGFAPVHIAEEISGNRFTIAGGEPGMKISWQVTGIRRDAFAEANRIQVEVDKPAKERGKYLHPEAHGAGEEFGIHYEQHKQMEQKRQTKSIQKMEQR